jgi:hypothetical protein
MAENDRPLPNPPRTRFGRQIRGEEEGAGPTIADRLAQAAAEGRLEEVLQHEIPEGEHARNLAMMMLGMSGMLPPGLPDPGAGDKPVDPASQDARGGIGALPPEVLAATMQGDVAGLTALLRAEHERRRGEGPLAGSAPGDAPGSTPTAAAGVELPQLAPTDPARAGIDKALVDEMIRVAAENQVTVDWLLLRAVKLYLEEHRRTGRL